MPTRSPRSRYRRIAGLIACIALVAAVAQVAGVGATRGTTKAVKGTSVATLAGAPVPDIGSTKLASAKVTVDEGETVRMSATAQLLADKLPKVKAGQGVCGISYTRDGDASWTLGTPYETLDLKVGKTAKTTIERSFAAPADDTYRMEVRCHVSAPATGGKVRGNAGISTRVGLPAGAAKPA